MQEAEQQLATLKEQEPRILDSQAFIYPAD